MKKNKTEKNISKSAPLQEQNKTNKKENIIVIDDDKLILEFFKTFLKNSEYSITYTTSPQKAFSQIIKKDFSLAIVDYLMPEMDGLEFLKKVKGEKNDVEIIIMTGLQDVKKAIEALRLGAYDYILKPFQIDEIKIAIKRALEHRSLIIAQKKHEQELKQYIYEATEQLKIANQELIETKEYLEQLLNTSVDGIFILSPSFQINYVNQGASQILDFTKTELIDKNLSFILAGSKEETKYIQQMLREKGGIQNYETEFIQKNKTQVPVNISFSCFKKESQKIHSILAIFKDITTQKDLENKLKEMSIKDGLTDLYNQRYFYVRLESEIERAKRQRHPLSLLLFDIDQFKTYNDCHGHLMGDKVLKAVGQIVKECTREHVDIGFRYGGDEFTVILPETDTSQAVLVADRIRISFQEKKFNGLTLSIGVIAYKENFSVRSFIRFADNCMYNAKRSGGNQINIFKKNK